MILFDIINTYGVFIIIISVGGILLYFCIKCFKKFCSFSSTNEMSYLNNQYNSKFSYAHIETKN